MRSIADIKAWQQAQVLQMGGCLSTAWFTWGRKENNCEGFHSLQARGFFNLTLAPTLEEFCSDDHDWSPTVYFDNEDDDDDESLLALGRLGTDSGGGGQELKCDKSKSALEQRRPQLYQSFFA